MEADEKYIEVCIAMGLTQKQATTYFKKLIKDKSIDCESKLLKAIIKSDIPAESQAYLCYKLGILKGQEHAERMFQKVMNKMGLNAQIETIKKKPNFEIQVIETLSEPDMKIDLE